MAIKRGQRPLEAGDSWSIDTAPGRVLYGAGVIDLVGEVVRELGGRRVLVVTDPGVAAAGHVHRASVSLREAGLELAVFYGVGENPGERHVALARVLTNAVENGKLETRFAKGNGGTMHVAGGGDSRIGDHQHPPAAEFPHDLADEVDDARAVEHPPRRGVDAPGVARFQRSLASLDRHDPGSAKAPQSEPIANTSERVAT